MATPRQYSLVKFDYSGMTDEWVKEYKKIFDVDIFIYLGEIPNMPGHCVLLRHSDGAHFFGYHIENFVELTEDEV